MALALGRLSLIDHMVNSRWGGNINGNGNGLPSSSPTSTSTSPISSPTDKNKTGTPSTASSETRSFPGADLVASRVCQGISIWCFGYGLFRYVSVRNHLTRGLFVPGIWGPVFMTCGSLGVFATVMHFDWRRDVREPVAALSSGVGVGEKKRE
ncbi:hypothetical protein Plec18167_002828 [Paecilomyces lecythidis]|uniref:Uncharacterized protein n=1 Tax=Paecilomyces lecythidis TaxID=3004212 RepID=A0ABR3Y3F5_9EURO